MSGLQLRTYGPLASMTFAIGLANQISATLSALGIAASVLPGCRPVGSSLFECTSPLAGGGKADQFVRPYSS